MKNNSILKLLRRKGNPSARPEKKAIDNYFLDINLLSRFILTEEAPTSKHTDTA